MLIDILIIVGCLIFMAPLPFLFAWAMLRAKQDGALQRLDDAIKVLLREVGFLRFIDWLEAKLEQCPLLKFRSRKDI